MKLMAEAGVRVRPGASPTDDVVAGYYEEGGHKTGRAKKIGFNISDVAHPCAANAS